MPFTPLLDRLSHTGSTAERPVPARLRPQPIRELTLVVALFLAYKVGRAVADGHVGRAYANAVRVWHWERAAELPSEADIQRVLLASQALIRAANVYYAWVHFTAMIIFLLWVYLFRPAHYIPLRRLVATVTGIALIVHLTFPLAPPRLAPGPHLIDTATVFGPSVYGPPSDDTLTNQYAAMPSLHVGWALIVAIGLIRTTRSRWRWGWLLYPACTFAVVVGTANHYWLDGLVAIAIVAVAARMPLVRGRGTPSAVAPIPRQRRRSGEPAARASAVTCASQLRYASAVTCASRLRYASAVTCASRLRYASAVTCASRLRYASAVTCASRLRYASAVTCASRLRYASAVTCASRLRYASAVTCASRLRYASAARFSPDPDARPGDDRARPTCPHTALPRRLQAASLGPSDLDRDTVRLAGSPRVRPTCAGLGGQPMRGQPGQPAAAGSGAADDRTGG